MEQWLESLERLRSDLGRSVRRGELLNLLRSYTTLSWSAGPGPTPRTPLDGSRRRIG